MRNLVRKCRGIGEVSVDACDQVGVMTRARALAMEAAAGKRMEKRRKINSGELQFKSSYNVQIQSRPRVVITAKKTVSENSSGNSKNSSGHRLALPCERYYCSSPSSDQVLASRCSSNGSSELVLLDKNLISTGLDLESEGFEFDNSACVFGCRESRETTPSSGLQAKSNDLESSKRPSEANSRRRSTAEITPSESELDEFFSAAENAEKKRFTEKYNFDVAKGIPLKGRYEWVRLKP